MHEYPKFVSDSCIWHANAHPTSMLALSFERRRMVSC